MGSIETHERGDCDCGRYHDVVADFGGRRPTLTVLCGSTRFASEFHRQTVLRTLAGEIVLSIGVNGRAEEDLEFAGLNKLGELAKEQLDELHLRKIELADKVMVINPGGYIGASTTREVLHAYHHAKRVEFLEKTCDNSSVGAFVADGDRLLVIERGDGKGIAPPAGHGREHGGTLADAMAAEITEETGLTVIGTPVGIPELTAWRANPCGRPHPGLQGIGHKWVYYTATCVGEVAPDPRETKGAWWATRAQLAQLAGRTVRYALGELSSEEFTAQPGIEPVWIRPMLAQGWLDLAALGEDVMARIEHVAQTGGPVGG